MQGQILEYSVQTNAIVITGEDGNRYTFALSEWKESALPARGMRVDFEVHGATAVSVYRAMAGTVSGTKSKVVAGVLGILLGGLGIHKFYLGYTVPGLIMLVLCCTFWPALIGLIEGIIYLTKSDEEFEELYVHQRKGWF